MTPPEQAEQLPRLLPDAKSAWLSGVGHIPRV